MVNSILCLTLYLIAWCKPKKFYLTFIAFILTNLRILFKMVDLENQMEHHYLLFLETMVTNSITAMFNLAIIMTHFKYKKLRNLTAVVMMALQFYIFVISMNKLQKRERVQDFER